MSDLFASAPAVPLAEALRPASIDEVIGQRHLLGPGKPLRLAFEARKPHSLILWGPPGVGKTTIARLMADAFDAEFVAFDGLDEEDALHRGFSLHEVQPPQAGSDAELRGRMVQSLGGRA